MASLRRCIAFHATGTSVLSARGPTLSRFDENPPDWTSQKMTSSFLPEATYVKLAKWPAGMSSAFNPMPEAVSWQPSGACWIEPGLPLVLPEAMLNRQGKRLV